jgi:hypothetical protein
MKSKWYYKQDYDYIKVKMLTSNYLKSLPLCRLRILCLFLERDLHDLSPNKGTVAFEYR